MGQRPDDPELDLLLSRGRLVGPSAERMRQQVLDAAAPARVPWWRRPLFVLPAVLAGAMTGAVLVGRLEAPAPPGVMSVKGTVESALVVALTCTGGTADACPRGARLSVALTGKPVAGYLGAFAEPVNGGERIWYFSREDGPATLSGDGEARMASRSVVLGSEHQGRYIVHVVISDRPLSRAELLDPAGPGMRGALPLVVVGP